MNPPAQGEVWWAELPDAGRRPTLVITRDAAIRVLRTILVAPITRTIRGIPTEIPLGQDHGLPTESVASVDNVQPSRGRHSPSGSARSGHRDARRSAERSPRWRIAEGRLTH